MPLDFIVSIREKRRGTNATNVIALVWRGVVYGDDLYVRVYRRSGWLIYETCIDRAGSVCIRRRARKLERPPRGWTGVVEREREREKSEG